MLTHVMSHTALLFSVSLVEFDAITWTPSSLRLVAGLAVGTWWLAFLAVLSLGESEYMHTFYSLLTAAQFERKQFDDGSDQTRARLFEVHRDIWKGFEGEIKVWLKENWTRWEEEMPTWFSEKWKDLVPLELRPDLHRKPRSRTG